MYGASYVWLSSGSCCVPKGCCNDCYKGIRNMKECESASFYGCYMTLCPWLRFGRNAMGHEEPGAKLVRTVDFATESVMGCARKR